MQLIQNVALANRTQSVTLPAQLGVSELRAVAIPLHFHT